MIYSPLGISSGIGRGPFRVVKFKVTLVLEWYRSMELGWGVYGSKLSNLAIVKGSTTLVIANIFAT